MVTITVLIPENAGFGVILRGYLGYARQGLQQVRHEEAAAKADEKKIPLLQNKAGGLECIGPNVYKNNLSSCNLIITRGCTCPS